MHEIHAGRVLAAAMAGRRVLVLAESATAGRDIFEAMREAVAGPGVESRRTVGREKLTFESGGFVRFLPLRSIVAARGLSLDEVFVPIGTSRAVLADLLPHLATSPVGLITGY